nr:transmembrane protein 127-like [Leptinotarsa decemlineata]
MSQRMLNTIQQWIHPKDDDSNVISATSHIITITLISMSLVDLTWFSINGNACVPYLTLGEFFWFGWNDDIDYTDYDCVNSKIVNMMRITILLCFMTIIFALMGFFLEIIGPKHLLYKSLRKYAIMATCSVIWIMVIIALSYYIVVLLEDSLAKVYPKVVSSVTYGIGFYLIVASGGVTCCGIVYTLLPIRTSTYFRDDDRCLLDAFDDNLDTFHSPTPPPPYCLPPPPYTP